MPKGMPVNKARLSSALLAALASFLALAVFLARPEDSLFLVLLLVVIFQAASDLVGLMVESVDPTGQNNTVVTSYLVAAFLKLVAVTAYGTGFGVQIALVIMVPALVFDLTGTWTEYLLRAQSRSRQGMPMQS